MTNIIKPQVTLLSYTPEPEKVVAAAARLCYSKKNGNELMEDFTSAQVEEFLKKLVDLGHESPFEHASFCFSIDGISRACSHQLVRHRVGCSYSQKSQRYVKETGFSCIEPNSIALKPEADKLFRETVDKVQEAYDALLALGVPAEDARFLLPNAASTSLVVTMNARSLMHFFELRCCTRAQWEIRFIAKEMLRQVKEVAPLLFAKAGAPCLKKGFCPEGKMSCGIAPTIEELRGF